MFGFVLSLAACGNKDAKTHTTDENVNTGNVAVANVDTTGNTTPDANFDEYQLNFDLTSSDASGNDMAMNMDVFQKGNKVLYVMNKMPVTDKAPFVTRKSLTTNGKNYIEIEMNGETNWFVAEGVDQSLLDQQMFNLGQMQEELKKDADSVKKETIDGKKMVCYYKNDGTQDGKACTYKGIFAYAEAVMLDGTNVKTVMKVSNYKDSVKDSVFKEPKDAKNMTELMGMMGNTGK